MRQTLEGSKKEKKSFFLSLLACLARCSKNSNEHPNNACCPALSHWCLACNLIGCPPLSAVYLLHFAFNRIAFHLSLSHWNEINIPTNQISWLTCSSSTDCSDIQGKKDFWEKCCISCCPSVTLAIIEQFWYEIINCDLAPGKLVLFWKQAKWSQLNRSMSIF